MLYLIIALLLVVIFYMLSVTPSASNQTVLMSSKYDGLVSNILNWNKTSRVVQDESFRIVIKSKVSMIDGESTYTLFEKADGNLKITYQTNGDTSVFGNINLELSYPQRVCVTNYDVVWAAIKENIQNSISDSSRRTAQDLVDGFYGK